MLTLLRLPPLHGTTALLLRRLATAKVKRFCRSSLVSIGTVKTPRDYMNDRSWAPSLRQPWHHEVNDGFDGVRRRVNHLPFRVLDKRRRDYGHAFATDYLYLARFDWSR